MELSDPRSERAWPSQTASDGRQATTLEADDPPAPGNLLARQVVGGTEMVDLYWTLSGDGGQPVVAYRVEVSDTRGRWPVDGTALPTPADTDRTSVAGLAWRSGDSGPRVAVINVAVAANPPEISGVVVAYNLQHTVSVETDNGLELDLPATLYYRVSVETDTGTTDRKMSAYTDTDVEIASATAVAAVPDGVPPVEAVEAFEHSALNPPAPVLDADDDVAVGTSDGPNDNDVTPGEITLALTKSTDGGTDDYRVDISDDGGKTWEMVHSSTRAINSTEYEHQGLPKDKERHFRLFTKNGSEYGVASNVVNDYSAHSHPPEKVEGLEANKDGAGKINLSWSAPKDDGGAMIDTYCIIAVQIDDDQDVVGGEGDLTRGEHQGGCRRPCRRSSSKLHQVWFAGRVAHQINGECRFQVAATTTNVVFTGVEEETRWRFQVYGLNGATIAGDPAPVNDNDPDTLRGVAEDSETVDDKTTKAVVPPAPGESNCGTGQRHQLYRRW